MGEREGGRKGRSSRYSDDLTVFSLFLFLSMRVRVYIREREDDDKGRQREGDRCEEAIFYLDFCPADSLKIYFVALASFASFAFVFFFFVNAFLPSSSQKEHTRKEEEEEEDFRLSFLCVK